MTAVIDTDAMCVREGERSIPFVLDFASGAAVLDPQNSPCEVRLLSWGEKCALARYASCGAGFIEQHLLSSCAPTAEEDALPSVLALIMWLHAPDGSPLPLDPKLLARVTADLCAALNMQVGDLAKLAVPEVEALWAAISDSAQHRPESNNPPYKAPLGADVTRIMVEPDPVSKPRPDAYSHPDPAGALEQPNPVEPHGEGQAVEDGQAPAHDLAGRSVTGEAIGGGKGLTEPEPHTAHLHAAKAVADTDETAEPETASTVEARRQNPVFRLLEPEPTRQAPPVTARSNQDGAKIEPSAKPSAPQAQPPPPIEKRAEHSNAAGMPAQGKEAEGGSASFDAEAPSPLAISHRSVTSLAVTHHRKEHRNSAVPGALAVIDGYAAPNAPVAGQVLVDPRIEDLVERVAETGTSTSPEDTLQRPKSIEDVGAELANELSEAAASLGIAQAG